MLMHICKTMKCFKDLYWIIFINFKKIPFGMYVLTNAWNDSHSLVVEPNKYFKITYKFCCLVKSQMSLFPFSKIALSKLFMELQSKQISFIFFPNNSFNFCKPIILPYFSWHLIVFFKIIMNLIYKIKFYQNFMEKFKN